MRFDKVLLASDFDGTLNDDNGQTPKCVLDAIRYFTENGGLFTACTGRTFQGLRQYAYADVFNAPALLSNGAMAYDFRAKQVVFCDGIEEDGMQLIRQFCKLFPDISVEMYPFNQTYAVHITEGTQRHFTNQGIPYTVIDDPAEAPLPWAKVMFCCPNERSIEAQNWLRAHPLVSFLETTGTFVEVLAKGVHKGSGLLKLAKLLGVSPKDVYAAGDGYNDVDMLRAANGAFVPCNGSKEALAAATHIVRSNNEGAIAHAIEILDDIYSKGERI